MTTTPARSQRSSGARWMAPVTLALLIAAGGAGEARATWGACRTEIGQTGFSGTSTTVTLDSSISDLSRAFLLVDSSLDSTANSSGADILVTGEITDASTLTFTREDNTDPAQVSYQLVECTAGELFVQRGEITISDGNANNSASLGTAVTVADSMVIISSRSADNGNNLQAGLVTGELTDSSTVRVERDGSGGATTGDTVVHYQVIDWSGSGASVQTGEVDVTGNISARTTVGLPSAVDATRSWLYFSFDAAVDGLDDTTVAGNITNAGSDLEFYTQDRTNGNRTRWYVVEFPTGAATVQRGVSSYTGSGSAGQPDTHDISLPVAVDFAGGKAFSFVTNTTLGNGGAFPRNRWLDTLTGATNLRMQIWRGDSANADAELEWQVVEFPSCTPAGPLSVTAGQTLGGDPIDICSIVQTNGATNVNYRISEGAGSCDISQTGTYYVDSLTYNTFGDNWSDDGSVLTATSGSSTGGPTGSPLEYTFNFTQAGTYYLWFNGNAADGAANSLWYGLDGSMIGNANWGTFGSFLWTSARWDTGPDPLEVTISSAGPHTLNIWKREQTLQLDGIFITANASDTPTGTVPPGSTTIDPTNCGSTLYDGPGCFVPTTGWIGGVKDLEVTGDDGCGTSLTPAIDTFTFASDSITVGTGTDPSGTSRCPGETAAEVDAFTLQTGGTADSIAAVQMTFAAGTAAGVGLGEVTSDDGLTVYGSQADPSDLQNLVLSQPIGVDGNLIQYKIRVTPKSHTAMAPPPGATYLVAATVTGLTSGLSATFADSSSATVTIDNQSPADATWGTVTAGDGRVDLTWTAPADSDFVEVVVLRGTSAIVDAPLEGTTYLANDTIGSTTVVFVGAGTSFSDTAVINGTDYWYEIFARDTCMNYATGAESGPHRPSAPTPPVTPGTPSAVVDGCDQITVTAPFSGDTNGNSSTTTRRGDSATGPWTAICSGVAGPSPRTCIDSLVAESSSYWYEVEFTDPDSVIGINPQVIGPFATPACAVNDTTTGTAGSIVSGCSQITVTAPLSGDANNNGSIQVEYNTVNSWPGTTACATVGGPSPRTCLVTGLSPSASYWTRVTFTDPDGVSGSNPQTLGPDSTTTCSGNGAPPMVMMLAPGRGGTIGGTDRFKVQIYDPDGLAATDPVQWALDGGVFSPIGVAVNSNYICNLGNQTGCAVYEFDVDTSALTNGEHYVTVRAVDGASPAATGQIAWPFVVNNQLGRPGGDGLLLRRTQSSQLCSDCHNLPAHSSQAISFQYGNWGQECSACHTPHLTRNIYLIRDEIETPSSDLKSVDFRNTDGVADFSYATPQASGNGANLCEVCHTKTKNSDGTARARNSAPTDWSKHYTSQCTSCHTHALGFGAGESEGGASCAGCHPDIWNNMLSGSGQASRHTLSLDLFIDDSVTWGSPLTANDAAVRSCLNMCHDDHPHDISGVTSHEFNAYRDATTNASRDATGAPSTANRSKTDFDSGATNGGLCVSCHRQPINGNWPTIAKGDYSGAAHDFTTNGFGAWSYTLHDGGVFDRNCTKCHSDGDPAGNATAIPFGAVHYSQFPRLLSNELNPSGNAATNVCYTCHGNGSTGTDRSGVDLATQTAKTWNHPVDDDTVHDGAAEFSASYDDGTFKGANRHVNCGDCHNSHAAGTTLHAEGTNVVSSTSPLNGATGVSFNPPGTNWQTTSSANLTWTTSVTREYETCFKCHSNFAFNGSPPTGDSGEVETDVAQEFSTSNASYHPIVGALPASDPGANGSSRLTSAQLTNGWSPGDTMYCSDCHGTEAAAPAAQGPHGSAIQFILRPSRNSSYTEWPGVGTINNTWSNSFCRNCHPMNEDGNWSNNRAHDKHDTRSQIDGCFSCHILVPHGGKMSRLIGDRDGNMPLRYAYQGDLSNMQIQSFTKSSTPDGYQEENCQAACHNKHDQPASENW